MMPPTSSKPYKSTLTMPWLSPVILSISLIVVFSIINPIQALENGLARTPPMGWLAWERYVCELDCQQYPSECIDFSLFYEMAERMIADGFKQVGYEYVNIDDCWSLRKREHETNLLIPDPSRFGPEASMLPLANKIHSLGLKLGIYGDCGTQTCQGFPGQLNSSESLDGNYFALDAQTFSNWHIDSFKFDGCYLNASKAANLCPGMGLELNKTGRPILFSCSWPAYENDEHLETNWSLVVERCNLWRSFGDIEDSWRSVLDTIDWFVKKQDLIVKYHGPGHWFDADQLVIGDFGLSFEEEQAQMAIWCIWASPLYMSNDLRTISKESSRILRNKYAIAINQDKMGIFGLMVHQASQVQVFIKPVEPLDLDNCPSYAIVYLDRRTLGNGRIIGFKLKKLIGNLHEKLAQASVSQQWFEWYSKCTNRTEVAFEVRDLFANNALIGKNVSLLNDQLRLRVDPSGVRMVQLFNDHKIT